MSKSVDYILIKSYDYGILLFAFLWIIFSINIIHRPVYSIFSIAYFIFVFIISYCIRKKKKWNKPNIHRNKIIMFFVILLIALISFFIAIPKGESLGYSFINIILILLFKFTSIFLMKTGITYKKETDFINNCGSKGSTFVNKIDKADFSSGIKKLIIIIEILGRLFIILFFSLLIRFSITHSIGAEEQTKIFTEELNNHGDIVFITKHQMQTINLYEYLTFFFAIFATVLSFVLRFVFKIKLEDLEFDYYH